MSFGPKDFEKLQVQAMPLAQLVGDLNVKVVLAESCTGGLVSALISMVPGISKYHCGSFATYRPPSKRKWLGVTESIIHIHTCESEQMAREMAVCALRRTPEADYSAAVVGHLGPNAPVNDGCYWIGMADRHTMDTVKPHMTHSYTGHCQETTRVARQFEIAFRMLEIFREHLHKHGVPK